MTRASLIEQIQIKKSCLCIGLDTDLLKIPQCLLKEADPIFAFNKAIIDATKAYCVSYKINSAFYEAIGVKGWEAMEKTVKYIGEDYFKIADAKRGDIGNTSDQYAKAFFETLPFDAITVAPYMGEDSVRPFLQYKGKWTIVLGFTSNKSAADFELQRCGDGLLYEKVLHTAAQWGTTDNLMFVVGATQASAFNKIREIVPNHFLLVPGIGAQGGSLENVLQNAKNQDGGLLINVSRTIIYASSGEDFAIAAGTTAEHYQKQMSAYF